MRRSFQSSMRMQNKQSGFRLLGRQPATRQITKLVLVLAIPVSGISDIQTATQTLSANVSPYGKVSVPGSISLRPSNTRFGGFSGSLDVSYWARTSPGGGGSVTIEANADFSPAGGPTITSVTYAC